VVVDGILSAAALRLLHQRGGWLAQLQPPLLHPILSPSLNSSKRLPICNYYGCDQQSTVFVGSYTLTPDLCNDRATYLSPTNTFSIVYSSDINMWTVATSCDSTVVRVLGGAGHEQFFPDPNDLSQCFV